MVRLTIYQKMVQRVDNKMVLKNVDILNIVENFVEWTTAKKDVFWKEKCMILRFG